MARAAHLEELPAVSLGELAPIVLSVCDRDSVAAGIIERLADEVVAFARAALRRLELTSGDPDVVLGGRVLRALPPGVIETITRGVEQVAPDARVAVTRSEPIVGAALLGLDAIGADPSAKARARAELDAAVEGLSAPSSSASDSSVATSTTRRSAPALWTPSSSITVQNGQATASVPAPVAAASRTRSSLIGLARSSIHMCAPPAPQQKVCLRERSISTGCATAETMSLGASSTSLWRAR